MVTMTHSTPMWGVYRVLKDGRHEYVSRTVTTSEKLAMEIASDLTIGRVVRPDGSTLQVPAHPHIHKRIAPSDPAPKGWDMIEPGPEQFAPTTDVTITLTLDEVRALIRACWVCDDESQALDDAAMRSAWVKLNELVPENKDE